jgi:hypothetical protein
VVVVTEPLTVTIEELVIDRGADVAEAVRGALEGHELDGPRVAEAVAAAVDAEAKR